jgi:phosphoglycolate phosphatase
MRGIAILAKLIIFDLDGTLFRTETVDIKAFNRALSGMGYSERKDKEILDLIGVPLDEICRVLLDTSNQDLIEAFKKDVIGFETEEITLSGKLYDGVPDFLNNLKRCGFQICICSNGNEEYVMDISNKFGFKNIFDEIWYEKKGITKKEAVGILKKKFSADKFVMVGDRLCDIEAGRDNGGISIGASYGFGNNELESADYIANSIEDLEKIIYKIFVC